MDRPRTRLTATELLKAHQVGYRRRHAALMAGVPDAHGAQPGEITADREAVAAAAEYAAAKWFDVQWAASHPGAHRNGPDIGRRTQIRSIHEDHLRLIVRPWDMRKYGDVPFLLVLAEGGEFTLMGWIMASQASVGEWSNAGRHDRPHAWFVHPRHLRHAAELHDA